MHEHLCMCSLLPRLETRTRVLLLLHHIEKHKPTNTGRLATFCLPNSEIIERGLPEVAAAPPKLSWAPESQPLFLFPQPGVAEPLANWVKCEKPITLIVPDGTWKQATRMKRRTPELKDVPYVYLPEATSSAYRLRIGARPEGLSTIEALARALGMLEGAHVEEALIRVFHIMVDRSLWAKGGIARDEVTGGVPTTR